MKTLLVKAIAVGFVCTGFFLQPARPAEQSTLQGTQLQDVQTRQQAMKVQMDLIRRTTDLKQRQQMLDEHLQTMLSQIQALSKMSGLVTDPKSQEGELEQRTDFIMSLIDQMISHYEMQRTCTPK